MKKPLKVTLVSAGVLLLLAIAVYAIMFARMVTPEQAQTASQKHFDDVKAKINTVSGYKIIKEGKPQAMSVQDEMGAKDYTLSADFLVQKQPAGSSAATIQADIADLAKRLPANEYGISVENTPQTSNPPGLICVYSSRYLNNDGSYIPQGSTANVSKYINENEFGGVYKSDCTDLLN